MTELAYDLAVFSGPLDLLLYLIRKHELDIADIPIALITEQFCAHVERMQTLDIHVAGEFLVVASMLMEIKSKMLLPREAQGEETEEELEDPRAALVHELLEYRRYREAAEQLDERGRLFEGRYKRPPDSRTVHDDSGFAADVTLWDLLTALEKVKPHLALLQPPDIIEDEVSIEVMMQRVRERLQGRGATDFLELFAARPSRRRLIATFLALLELVRLGELRVRQDGAQDRIVLEPEVPLRGPAAGGGPCGASDRGTPAAAGGEGA